jgi:signal-transduction protein with cAMP-binding, CBS, and nucleotidyltransferase domain
VVKDFLMGQETEGSHNEPPFASTRDLAATYIKENARLVKDVMTDKVISVQETTPVSEIADLLERHRIKRVPVLYDGELLGIVSPGEPGEGVGQCAEGSDLRDVGG